MEIIQFIILIFVLFALSRAFLRFKKNDISLGAFLFWLVLWIGVLMVDLFPGIVSWVARTIGLTEGLGLIIYFSIIILFYLTFRLYVMLENQNRTITELVRKTSLNEGRKGKPR